MGQADFFFLDGQVDKLERDLRWRRTNRVSVASEVWRKRVPNQRMTLPHSELLMRDKEG